MKKISKFALVSIALVLMSQAPKQKPKEYYFKLNEVEVSALWDCLDKSEAPHLQVTQIQDVIRKQFLAQQDTTNKK
jgi:hypothetical protein